MHSVHTGSGNSARNRGFDDHALTRCGDAPTGETTSPYVVSASHGVGRIARAGKLVGTVWTVAIGKERYWAAITTASIFLCTSTPAIRYGIGVSWGGAERVPDSSLLRVTGYGRVQPQHDDAHLFAQVRTLLIIQLNGLDGSTGSSISPLRAAAILPNGHQFSWVFASCSRNSRRHACERSGAFAQCVGNEALQLFVQLSTT